MDHHAVFMVGDGESALGAVFDVLAIPDECRQGHPDVQTYTLDQVGIDETRELQASASNSPILLPVRTFVIVTRRITLEGQNALLKLFEDPPSTARFALLMPKSDSLIPTLRSRLFMLSPQTEEVSLPLGAAFLEQSYKDRLAEIATRTKAGDNVWVASLLNDLERMYADVPRREKRHEVLQNLVYVQNEIGNRGASVKMLLEDLALSIPYGNARV